MSGSFASRASAIRARYKSQVADALSIVTQYPNQSFDKPSSGVWASMEVLEGESRQASIGSPGSQRFRNYGVLMVSLRCLAGEGTGTIEAKADGVADAFRAVTFSGITFRTPTVQRGGRIGEWYQVAVACPFYADDIT